MNKFKIWGLVGLAATALFASQAFATPCPAAPVGGSATQGTPVCIATTSTDGAGDSLQDQLNDITLSGPGINVYTQQAIPSSFWSIGATGSSENKIVLEIAGNASKNTFGIFDPTDPSTHLQLFSGPASAGWTTTLTNLGGGHYTANYFNASAGYQGGASAAFGITNEFGYYLDGPGGFFFSDPAMNETGGTTYPNGMPHMVSFEGDGATTLQTGATSGTFLPNEYLLAWEDQPFSKSDLDYNDFVVLVESVHPVPEPAVLGMFGLGILMIGLFAGIRRRRHNG